MKIKRDLYLQRLINRIDNGMIKVITGIRRSGKSYLLNNLTDKQHIIEFELDRIENKKYRKPDIILEEINSLIVDNKKYYILLDEIQMLEEFEKVLNSLLHKDNVDIYVTGSNSKFLSHDILTEFRGRGNEIHIYPLSFKEYMSAYEGDKYQGWADYVTYGGLPQILSMKTEEQKINYLTRLFEETYIKDIMERNKIEKIQELNDLINVLASCVGSLSDPSKILSTFKNSIKSDISLNTIRKYIEYLKNAFVINEAYHYDVKGRKYIGTPLKYYFEDVGLRNARLEFRQVEETHLMENIIYNELKIRGYKVDVGMVTKTILTSKGNKEKKQLEVDFIANLGSKRYYIQSALSLSTEEKVKQEKASLTNINDSFKKIILVKDVIKVKRDEDGIVTMNVYDFLLNDNSLEF